MRALSRTRRGRRWFVRRSVRRLQRPLRAATMLTLVAVWLAPPELLACMGNPPPPSWGRSTVLGKMAPAVFPLAGAGGPAVIPTLVFVAASGPVGAPCTPVTTTVTLTLACVPPPPAPPGAVIGAITVPTPVPGIYFVPVPVAIPAGPLRVCALTGTATTVWANGATSTGAGDIEICIVEEAPGMPGVPRLDLALLTPELQTAHPGDQRVHGYSLTNNDPNHSVTVTLTADSEQTARLPVGSPEPPGSGSGVFAIADPGGGDNFPIAFLDDLFCPPGPGNNYRLDDGTQEDVVGTNLGSVIWLQQFDVIPGREVIDKISVAYGTGANGERVSVLLYDDPDNDGDPNDAVLLTEADAVAANEDTGIYNEVAIEPTDVGPAGDSFFVGVVMQHAVGTFPGAVDNSSALGRSWFVDNDECAADVLDLNNNAAPPIELSATAFPANWMLRAHGTGEVGPLGWVELPPDPMDPNIPSISRSFTLCPGESRVIEIATRAWPMCPPGSACEQRVKLTGTFDNGDPALACAAANMLVDTTVPPEFMCPDGGMTANAAIAPPDGLQFEGSMPTHPIEQLARLDQILVQPIKAPPLQPLPPQLSLLSQEEGRITAPQFGDGEPAIFVDQFFDVVFVVEFQPLFPTTIQTELIELKLHGASPVIGDTYFSGEARAQVLAPSIPPDLDTFLDLDFQVSVNGNSVGYIHSALIDQGSISLQIIDPTHMEVAFNAVFPSDPNDPNQPPDIDVLDVVFDAYVVGTGVPAPVWPAPCIGDLDDDGDVDLSDLAQMLANYNTPSGANYEDGDLDGDGDVDLSDLAQLLSVYNTPCP